MATAKQAQDHLVEARRQGQFEGQVLTTLQSIQQSVNTLTAGQTGFDSRLTAVEKGILTCSDSIAGVQHSLEARLAAADAERGTIKADVEELKAYKLTARGVLLVLGFVIPICSSVITALIIKFVTARI